MMPLASTPFEQAAHRRSATYFRSSSLLFQQPYRTSPTCSIRSTSRTDSGQPKADTGAPFPPPRGHLSVVCLYLLWSLFPNAPPPTQHGPAPLPWTYRQIAKPPSETRREPPDAPKPWQRASVLPAVPLTTPEPPARYRPNMIKLGPSEQLPPLLQQHQQKRQQQSLNRQKTSSPTIEGWRLCRAPCISFVLSLLSTCYPCSCIS